MTDASFAALSRKGMERFVQTVLVIDNELTLVPAPEAEPVRHVVVPEGFGRRDRAALRGLADEKVEVGEDTPKTATDVREGLVSSALDAKQIMDAFLRRSMICGMHKPEGGDDLVSEAIKAARSSDAVIVDWKLDGSDTRPAREIVAGIMRGDAEEQGRLRLIVVYTSEPDVGSVAKALREHLVNHAFDPPGSDTGLLGTGHTRIVVLNKQGTVGGIKVVSVPDLPERIIQEFAYLSGGVLGTFAVTAVAAVRRAVHHVLAIFSEDMDGAFLGHMCALTTPEDAREFALDLLASELRSVASMDADTTAVLDADSVALHIDTLAEDGNLMLGNVELPIALARTFPRGGAAAVAASFDKQVDRVRKSQPKKADAVTARNVGYAFGKGAASSAASHHRFARLSSFKTELFDRIALPSSWSPTLSLGSLIIPVPVLVEPDEREFLLCTQPRCDAVRLAREGRRFPFQVASVAKDEKFNLVAAMPGKGSVPETLLLQIDSKPHATRMIEFRPRPGEDRVLATKAGAGTSAFVQNRFEFADVDGRLYLWIGDLRELTAQRVASMVAARLHEVGLDVFEWLRLRQ